MHVRAAERIFFEALHVNENNINYVCNNANTNLLQLFAQEQEKTFENRVRRLYTKPHNYYLLLLLLRSNVEPASEPEAED